MPHKRAKMIAKSHERMSRQTFGHTFVTAIAVNSCKLDVDTHKGQRTYSFNQILSAMLKYIKDSKCWFIARLSKMFGSVQIGTADSIALAASSDSISQFLYYNFNFSLRHVPTYVIFFPKTFSLGALEPINV